MLIPVLVFASLVGVFVFQKGRQEVAAFVSGALYLAFMLVGAVYSLYPVILPAIDPQYNLTIAEFDHRQLCAAGWVAVVDCRHGHCAWLFRLPVSHVPRQGDPRKQ